MLSNLLSNAIKFTEKGGIAITLRQVGRSIRATPHVTEMVSRRFTYPPTSGRLSVAWHLCARPFLPATEPASANVAECHER